MNEPTFASSTHPELPTNFQPAMPPMLRDDSRSNASTIDPELAWRLVRDRNRDHDGDFVYAVRTTGIYCRPSCPSRRPKRENVDFYPQPVDAERAGFRACRRCRPENALSPAAQLVERAVELLEVDDPDAITTLEALAEALDASPSHLRRTFKRVLGLSPAGYASARRWQRLSELLGEETSVTDAIYAAGFGSGSRVYESAHSALGMTPDTVRRGGQGMTIHFSVVDCELGRLLVATTDRGLCAVALGDHDLQLENDLRQRFPKATIEGADRASRELVDQVVAHCQGEAPATELPLDLRGTAFQLKVWQELRRIPKGQTRTYTEVAQALGAPRSARAVARACATNPVAVVVPCHRVVRADGGLGGYRWGLERKAKLLDRESDE